ncbi:hypothetical protein [Pseudidiomarina sp.]|uniref:hypothetical protein n=1 Tax=Pseudidiomarina sp. TaxID=2081707 RepID=UPI003A970F30
MKYLLGVFALLSTLACADSITNGALIAFSKLSTYEETYTAKNISLRGFLFLDEGELLFCSNRESCYSRGKERVVVKASGKVEEYLKEVSECHMELSGEFRALNPEQSDWPILGFLYVGSKPEFDFSSMYDLINDKCRAFNVMNAH